MRKHLLAATCGLTIMLAAGASSAQAQSLSNGFVKIGVLADMSGVYSAIGGPGEVLAAKMAIKDFGGTVSYAQFWCMSD